MKFKKVLSGFLLLTVLSVSGIAVFANNSRYLDTVEGSDKSKEIIPISDTIEKGKQSYFNYFSGKIMEINDYSPIEGAKIVFAENDFGSIANIIISKDTYVVNGEEPTIGDTITGYYKANTPMIMIYPPQYSAEVAIIGNKYNNIKVDKFDEDLVSADNLLKLNIDKDTDIISVDGKPFEGDLKNRNLVVIYDISTKSIPAQMLITTQY